MVTDLHLGSLCQDSHFLNILTKYSNKQKRLKVCLFQIPENLSFPGKQKKMSLDSQNFEFLVLVVRLEFCPSTNSGKV